MRKTGMLIVMVLAAEAGWGASSSRLYFTPERLEALKGRIAAETPVAEAWRDMLARADRLVDDDLVSLDYAESGSGQHGNYGRPSSQISTLGGTLGLAYRMTGQSRYAEKLRQALLHYAQLKRWAGDAQRDPPWNSELNTARFCFGYAVGYDSIRETLSEADRTTIVTAMVQRGILPTLNDWVLPERRIHALDSMGHNWWSVCVSMAGVASLAVLDDEPRAEQWVERVREGMPEWFAYQGNILQNKSPNFDEQGAFYESVNYANYGLSEYLLFHLAYSHVFSAVALPRIPLLDQAGDFFVDTSYPTSDALLSVNFGDSSMKAGGARTLRLLLANGIDRPAYHWYVTRTSRGLNDPIGLVYDCLGPREAPPARLRQSVNYADIGWAMMRSSWEDDATLLAVKSGFAWNHAHPDAGSFILFHGGKPLIIDSGNCSYSRREYTSYYRQSKAHNVVLIDGVAENPEACGGPDRGVVHPGRTRHLMDAAGIKYLLADATGPTAWKFSRNYRHFLWIDDVILVFDDVRTHEPGQLEWLLHYEGQAEERGSQIVLSNGARSRALVRPLYPRDMEIVTKKGLKDHEPDTEVEYLAFVPRGKHRDMKFITAIVPQQRSGPDTDLDIELLEGDEMLGVRIGRGAEITEVFLNLRADGRRMHRNSNKTIHGWETDAYLFGTTRAAGAADDPDALTRCFVVCGSYLRKNDKVLIDSLSKVYAIVARDAKALDVTLQGQPVIRCDVRASQKPDRVMLNGNAIRPSWDRDARVVTFRQDRATRK